MQVLESEWRRLAATVSVRQVLFRWFSYNPAFQNRRRAYSPQPFLSQFGPHARLHLLARKSEKTRGTILWQPIGKSVS